MALLRSGKSERRDVALASHDEARRLFEQWRATAIAVWGPARDLGLVGVDNQGLEWKLQRASFGTGIRTVRLRIGVQGTIASALVDVEPARSVLN